MKTNEANKQKNKGIGIKKRKYKKNELQTRIINKNTNSQKFPRVTGEVVEHLGVKEGCGRPSCPLHGEVQCGQAREGAETGDPGQYRAHCGVVCISREGCSS